MTYYKYYSCVRGYGLGLEVIPFSSVHFAKMGLKYMSVGMPQLEALQLVNGWNVTAAGTGAKFWLQH